MSDFLRKLRSVSMLVLLTSCANRPPVISFYDIMSPDLALCGTSDGDECDPKPIEDMIGYTCISPLDEGRVKKWVRKTTETDPLLKILKMRELHRNYQYTELEPPLD